jgi:hypothetical protein
MSDGNVVFLNFGSDKLKTDDDVVIEACAHCRNKTFTVMYDSHNNFPMMRCAACGSHIGRIGWANDES